ncbi:alpha/beta fold hydrolase [Falsiroseomonas tokyonensis]|uniref:Alpha/beta fold hydrolase n=1 Tax=Falsiroseomonas tokyonensis TaxID=430521 RepID=A0ABV7BUN7_9PROT|nr:alpha/beta hydrolase [Falsiroseomonas tokyonensis]MBU8538201.1 alpha/beta hydrolase [Falsiroseomonas tokyonensis]
MIEGEVALPDLRLAYWDTGGDGTPVVLLHAASGSKDIWEHQLPALRGAGYRVIAYSRRGHAGSETGPKDAPGTGSGDLLGLLDRLGLGPCHLVGTAAGGLVATDFALTHPDRLRSLTLACTIVGVVDEDYLALGARLRPPGFTELPIDFQELGPSYRAENPEGVARWLALERRAHPGGRFRQPAANALTWQALRGLAVRTLLVNGDADLWAPPAIQRLFLRRLPNARGVVIAESGHSAYWEQPEAFNAALLDFLAEG